MTISSLRARSPGAIAAMQLFRQLVGFFRPVFALDLRSLAVTRVGLAGCILMDLVWRIRDVPAFLTDHGVLSRMLRLEMIVPNDPRGLDYQWSVHLASGQAWFQYALMAVAAWFAIWLLIGYRTRLAAVVSWIMLVSLGNRNPLIYDGGDAVLRSLLFWAMFLPLGARFSWDARRQREKIWAQPDVHGGTLTSIVSFASAAFMLQLLVVYFSAAVYKWNPVWLSEFSGVYYALNCDPFATRLGLVVRNFPGLMKVLTAVTMFLEVCGPILVLAPWCNRTIRTIAVMAFCLLHVGMAATLTLGIFPWICISAWLAFLPDVAWDRWLPAIRRQLGKRWPGVLPAPNASVASIDRTENRDQGRHAARSRLRVIARVASEFAVGALFVYAVLWNLRDAFDDKTAQRILPDRMNKLAQSLGLEKGWCMFAPIPRQDDGWPIFKGVLRDGTEVNLWQPDKPIPWSKPEVVSEMYLNQRWRRFLENMTMENYTLYRPYFCDWLQKRWDQQHARGNPARQVVTVEMLRQLETTPPPGDPIPPPETMELWTKHYGESVEGP